MRHDAQMATIRRGQTHDGVVGAVGVVGVGHGRLTIIVHILHGDAVLGDRLVVHGLIRPEAATLTVSNPHTQRGALHALQHDGVALLDAHVHEARLEAARLVLHEAGLLLHRHVGEGHHTQLGHQLTAIAHTQ